MQERRGGVSSAVSGAGAEAGAGSGTGSGYRKQEGCAVLLQTNLKDLLSIVVLLSSWLKSVRYFAPVMMKIWQNTSFGYFCFRQADSH